MSAHRERTPRLRACLLMTLLALGTALSACGGDVAGTGTAQQPASDADAAVPSSRDEDASGTVAPSTAATPDGAARTAEGPLTELRGSVGDDPAMHAAMTAQHGDGSAEPQLLAGPALPDRWRLADPDGPHFARSVCGVQLDPVKPRDAAQRRWGLAEEFTYLESEVHLFAEPAGHGLAGRAAEALAGCDGYGVLPDGREVDHGEGEVNVLVEAWRPEGARGADAWVLFTETENAHMVQLGHPQLFDPDYVGLLEPRDVVFLNAMADELNARMARVARENGVHFIDPTETFRG